MFLGHPSGTAMSNTPQCNTLDEVLARHEREEFAFKLLTGPEQRREQIRMLALYRSDPWAFLSDCVFTLDQVSQNNPIKPFPSYLSYTEFFAKTWMRRPLIVVPKSRRMICSWTCISLFTHDTIFNPGRFNAFVSKKEDDSGDLVSRAEFIYNKIPTWRIPRALLPKLKNGKMSKQPPLLEFEDIHSKIQGFPQGADQMRQFTFSGMLFDEWAFWEEAQASYSAAKPTLDGGGRLTGISSRSPGFFKKIVFDQLDAQDLTFKESPPVPVMRPMEGVEIWQNPKNRFTVIDLHYTADPRKRSPEWRDAIKQSMPARDFAMEYERSWQTFEGKPVYSDFKSSLHVKTGKPPVEPNVPIILCVDFGLTPAMLLIQPIGRRLRILKEFIETDGSIEKLGTVVMNYLRLNFQSWVAAEDLMYTFIDPAGFQRVQTDARTCADILRKLGFRNIRPGPVGWEERRKSVEDYLVKSYGEGPGLEIYEDGCPILIEGFNGGYRYPEKALEVEPEKIRPIKNKYSHPHDALQYGCVGAAKLRHAYGINLPVPSYDFHNKETQKWPEEKSTKNTVGNG